MAIESGDDIGRGPRTLTPGERSAGRPTIAMEDFLPPPTELAQDAIAQRRLDFAERGVGNHVPPECAVAEEGGSDEDGRRQAEPPQLLDAQRERAMIGVVEGDRDARLAALAAGFVDELT